MCSLLPKCYYVAVLTRLDGKITTTNKRQFFGINHCVKIIFLKTQLILDLIKSHKIKSTYRSEQGSILEISR